MIGGRTGIFPSNYVQPVGTTDIATSDAVIKEANKIQQNIADEARNQEEADTEVSEINTQPKMENVQEVYSRPMSSSSTVRTVFFIHSYHSDVEITINYIIITKIDY